MSFIIGGIQKSSLIDYPEKIATIVFTQGCNLRCGYCHNPGLLDVRKKPTCSVSAFLDFLENRRGKLDAVVITGGEPCLHKGLKNFIKQVKALGFLVKLDTNGSFPDVLQELLTENLLDYIAMDIKSPLENYSKITKTKVDTKKIYKSIELIMNSSVDYEFRTTVLKPHLNVQDFEKIGQLIKGAKKYFLQKFVHSKGIHESLMKIQNYTEDEFRLIINMLKKNIDIVQLR